MRVPAEDRRQVAQVIEGREYRARDGWFDMPDRHARMHLRSAGYGDAFHVPGVAGPRAGYPCRSCGFASLFVACSRCGAVNPRESANVV